MYPVRETGMPPTRRNAKKYPWHELTVVGKSFDVPIADPAYYSIRHTAKCRQKRSAQRYSCRIVYDDKTRGAQAMRVTRIK